jgi:DHA1 family bicyclomycin/chloramphenicol resistance-like MFS transporter
MFSSALLGSVPYFTFLMSGNFTVSRLAHRVGIDTLKFAGIGCEFIGACFASFLFIALPDGGPATVFMPQFIISFGSGLLLPNCIAVRVRPHSAGAASGLAGFTQMATGAACTQIISMLLAQSTSALPMAWMMLVVVALAFGVLVRR